MWPLMKDPGRFFGEDTKKIFLAGKGPEVEDNFFIQLCDSVTTMIGNWKKNLFAVKGNTKRR